MKCTTVYMDDAVHKLLRMRALTDGRTMNAIVMELIEGYLRGAIAGAPTPITEPAIVSVPIVERTSSVGQSEVTEVRPIHAKKKESEWAQGMCPKHGRMAINGKFTCC